MKCIKMGAVGHYSQIDMPLLTGGISTGHESADHLNRLIGKPTPGDLRLKLSIFADVRKYAVNHKINDFL